MARKYKKELPRGEYLEDSIQFPVRFQEVDSLQVVWHGHYYSYFEVGRTSLGRKYGIHYKDIKEAGLSAPIVETSCYHIAPLHFGDEVLVVTRLFKRDVPKLEFSYEVFQAQEKKLCALGKSVQVFLDTDHQLLLDLPLFMKEFYVRWRDHMVHET